MRNDAVRALSFRHAGDGGMRTSFGTVLFVLLVALSMVVASPVSARQPDIAAMAKRFAALNDKGDYAGALIEGQKLEAAVQARVGLSHRAYGMVLSQLGNVYESLGKHAEA